MTAPAAGTRPAPRPATPKPRPKPKPASPSKLVDQAAADDAIFATVDALRADLETPVRPLPVSGRALADGPVNSGRGGEVPGSGRPDRFSLPLRPAVPRFDDPALDPRLWAARLGIGPQHDFRPVATVEGPPWPSTPPLPPPHPQKQGG